MGPSERIVNFGLRVPIGFLMASAMMAVAWGGERPSPTGEAFAQPVLPQDLLDQNFLDYGKLRSDFSAGDRKFSPPSPSRSRGKRIGFDLKTDYDVDVEKFLPTEGYPLYAPNANGNQQNMSAPKKKPFFMGLSVTKPLN
jgi:hypothetical protein